MSFAEFLAKYEPLSNKRGFTRIGDDEDWAELDLKWIQDNISDLDVGSFGRLTIIPKITKYPKVPSDSLSDFGSVIAQLKTTPNITFTDEFIDKIHSHYLAWETKMLFISECLQVRIKSFHNFTESHRKSPFTGVPVELTQEELVQVIEDLKLQINFVRPKCAYNKLSEALADNEVKSIEEGMKYVKENILSWYVDSHMENNEDYISGIITKTSLENEINQLKKTIEYYQSLIVRFHDL